MRLLVLLATLCAGALQLADAAHACSCAGGEPRDRLAAAEAAFVGVVVGVREEPARGRGEPRTITRFRVEERVKGELRGEIDLVTSLGSCSLTVRPGERLGLLPYRWHGRWSANACSTIDPDELRAAAAPFPAPTGDGSVGLFVGAAFGEARVAALDRRGRVIAYGRGRGTPDSLAVCPGSRRLVEAYHAPGGRPRLAIRRVRDLRVKRDLPLPVAPGELLEVTCQDAGASGPAVLAGGRQVAVLKVRGRRVVRLHRAWASAAGFARGVAHLVQGTRLVAVDLRDARRRSLGDVPRLYGRLAATPDGRLVAGGDGRRLVLAGPTTGPRSLPLRDARPLGWMGSRRLVVLHARGIVVLDARLRSAATLRLEPALAALSGRVLWATGPGRALRRARLPRGPVHRLAPLPTAAIRALAVPAGRVELEGAPRGAPSPVARPAAARCPARAASPA